MPLSHEQVLHPSLHFHVVPDAWITPLSLQLEVPSVAPPSAVWLLEPELPQPVDRPMAAASVVVAQSARCEVGDERISSTHPKTRGQPPDEPVKRRQTGNPARA